MKFSTVGHKAWKFEFQAENAIPFLTKEDLPVFLKWTGAGVKAGALPGRPSPPPGSSGGAVRSTRAVHRDSVDDSVGHFSHDCGRSGVLTPIS